jgi:predicted dehydrogenase
VTARLALLGCGWVADMHARAAATCGHTVVGVANHRLESAQRFAAAHGIERVTTDWHGLVSAPDVDVVVVCTPNALHAEQSIAALAAGKHVLCEKPMATSVADGEAMLAAAAEHDRLLLVLHPWRHHEAVIALRDAIAAGELGRVVRTHGYGVHADWGPGGWFTDPALAGGGALVDMGIHAIDTARFLLGEPEPRRVQASIATAHGTYPVDDDGLVLIDWEGGCSLRRRVGLVAISPRGLRGRHGGLRQHRVSAHLGARAAARLRALRRDAVHRAAARCARQGRGLAARNAIAGARPRGAAHLRAGLCVGRRRVRSRPLIASSGSPASQAPCGARPSTAGSCGPPFATWIHQVGAGRDSRFLTSSSSRYIVTNR